MIKGYSRPQLLIRQVLQSLPSIQVRTLNAFVVGPQFDLFRYTNTDERAAMKGVAFVENISADPDDRQLVAYEGLIADKHIIDEAFTRLYGESLEGQQWLAQSSVVDADTNTYDFRLTSLDSPNKIQVIRRGAVLTAVHDSSSEQITSASIVFAGSGYTPLSSFDQAVVGGTGDGAAVRMTSNSAGVIVAVVVIAPGAGYSSDVTFKATPAAAGANVGVKNLDNGDDADGDGIVDFPLIPELFGRPIRAGDVLYATLGSTTVRRSVKNVERETVPSHYGSNGSKNDKRFAASPLNPGLSAAASFGNVSAPTNWTVALAADALLRLEVTNVGSGYTSAPTVSISTPLTVQGALAWPTQQATASADINTSGVVSAAHVAIQGAGYYSGAMLGFLIVNGGSGYDASNPPTIVIADAPTGGVTATVEPVISGGKITNLKITNPGAGYTTHKGNISPYATGLTLEGGAGTGAEIIMIASIGAVRSVSVVDPGTYTSVPTVTLTGTQTIAATATAFLGATAFEPNNAGSGYAVNDVLTVSGGTSTITAKAIVRSVGGGGEITALDVSVIGKYSVIPSNPVTLTGGGGSSATADVTWGVSTVVIANPGSGYLRSDAGVTFSAGAATAFPDVIDPVIVEVLDGGGSGATVKFFNQSIETDWDGLLQGAVYNGQYGERYTITVTHGGSAVNAARVRVRSNSGAFSANNVPAYHYGLGYLISHESLGGLAIELRYPDAAQPLRLGDQFSFVVVGKYEPLNLSSSGELLAINILDGGNYSVLPTGVTISAPPAGGVQATATVAGSGSAITSFTIQNPGSGYTAAPLITLTGGTVVTAAIVEGAITTPEVDRDLTPIQSGVYTGPKSTRYRLEVIQGSDLGLTQDNFGGAVVRVSDTAGVDTVQEYTVTNGTQYDLGTYGLKFIFPTGLVSPSGATGSAATGVTRFGVRNLVVDDPGVDYVVGDIVTIPGTGTAATYRVTSVNGGGSITGIVQVTPGAYSVLPVVGNIDDGSGTGATVDSFVTYIASVVVTSAGSGYATAPEVTATGGSGSGLVLEATVVNGAVVFVAVTSSGSGYLTLPTLTFTAPVTYQGGLRKGDVYFLDAVATAKTGAASVIVLNGQAADITGWTDVDLLDNKFDIDVRVPYTGIITPKRNSAPDLAWESGDASVGGILVKDTLATFEGSRDEDHQWLPVKNSPYAKLFAHWRGLVPADSTSKILLYNSEASIVAKFGAFDTDNPVCYGAIIAFRGAQQKAVFVSNLATDNLAGYQTVLRQAERNEGCYALAPMTYDRAVHLAVQEHVNKVSAPDWKLWRRVYVTTKNPGSFVVMNEDSEGNTFDATVTSNASGNVRVVCANANFLTRGIRPLDKFRTNFSVDEWNEATWDEFEVLSVLEEDELILKTGPAAPISPAIRFEIWRPDNGLSQAEFIGARSNSFLDRRVINIWCDSPVQMDANGEIQFQELYFLAAEVAGLRSAVLPQQGLTYTELDFSVTGAPLMFTKYTQEELNIAAANGTLIITQDVDDGPVIIRHQLTTDSVHGPLFWEDSVGTNLDNIAYSVKDIFQPYIGKRNANPETLEEMETKMRDLLDGFKNNPGGFTLIGPALIAWSALSVTIDPVFRDRVNIEATLELPLPINGVTVTLKATQVSDATLITFTATQLAA
jgi:hypothetical protein